MKSICGADCSKCELYNKKCSGCNETKGCPFGKKCWIAKYLEIGGEENFNLFQKELLEEINSLKILGMPQINELYPLHGEYVNLEYTLPNGIKTKFLNDNEAYLGNQVECTFNNSTIQKYFGIVCNTTFILICEYKENGTNPELLIYKKR